MPPKHTNSPSFQKIQRSQAKKKSQQESKGQKLIISSQNVIISLLSEDEDTEMGNTSRLGEKVKSVSQSKEISMPLQLPDSSTGLSPLLEQSNISQGSAISNDQSPPALIAFDPSLNTKTFHLFPQLSVEARVMIWKYAMPQARIAGVRLADDTSISDIVEDRITLWNRPTPLFYVNQESRFIALAKYSLQISSSPADFCRSRIDPTRDRVLIQWHHAEGDWYSQSLLKPENWSEAALTEISHIAVDSRMIRMGMDLISSSLTANQRREKTEEFEVRKMGVLANLMRFSGLKELAIVYHNRHCITTPSQAMWDFQIALKQAHNRKSKISELRNRVALDISFCEAHELAEMKWDKFPRIEFDLLRVGGKQCCNFVGDQQDTKDDFLAKLQGEDLSWAGDKMLRKGVKDFVAPRDLLKDEEPTPDWFNKPA